MTPARASALARAFNIWIALWLLGSEFTQVEPRAAGRARAGRTPPAAPPAARWPRARTHVDVCALPSAARTTCPFIYRGPDYTGVCERGEGAAWTSYVCEQNCGRKHYMHNALSFRFIYTQMQPRSIALNRVRGRRAGRRWQRTHGVAGRLADGAGQQRAALVVAEARA